MVTPEISATGTDDSSLLELERISQEISAIASGKSKIREIIDRQPGGIVTIKTEVYEAE